MSTRQLSIIIPLYNAEKFIKQLFSTLIEQTYSSFQVIFIEDCSTDNTRNIMQEKLELVNDNRFQLIINEKNLGISKTKNKALKLVNTSYVMFFDQDDLLAQNALELLMKKVELGSDYVVGSYAREYNYKKPFYDKMFEFQSPLKEETNKSLTEIPELLTIIHQALWAKVYSVSLFENFEFDENLHGVEDLGSTSILLAKAEKISVVEQVIYYYQYSKSSTINEANSSYVVEDTYRAYNNFYNYYKENNLEKTYFEELEYLYIYHCVLSVMIRTYQRTRNYKELIKNVYAELEKRFPNYKKNKYYKKNLKVSKYFIILNKNSVVQYFVSQILLNR